MSSISVRTALRRRWYVALVGLLLTLGGAIMTMNLVPAQTELTASVLLLPPKVEPTGGAQTPSNPYLQLGGLETVVGLVARALTAPTKLESMAAQGATGEIKVAPDLTMPGAVVIVTVDGKSRAEAAETLDIVLEALPRVLADLQAQVSTPAKSFITSSVVDKNITGEVVRKQQYRAILLAGGGGAAGTVLLAMLVDILVMRRRREGHSGRWLGAVEPTGDPGADVDRVVAAPTWTGEPAPPRSYAPAQPGPRIGFNAAPHLSPYPKTSPMAGRPVGQMAQHPSSGVRGENGANGISAPQVPIGCPDAEEQDNPVPRQDVPLGPLGRIRSALSEQGREGRPESLILPDRFPRRASAKVPAQVEVNGVEVNGHGTRPGPGQAESVSSGGDVGQGQPPPQPLIGPASGVLSDEAGGSVPGAGVFGTAVPDVTVPGDSGQGAQGQGLVGMARHASASTPQSIRNASVAAFGGASPAQLKAEDVAEPGAAKVNPDSAAAAGPPTGGFERLLHPKNAPQDSASRAAAHRLP